MADELIEGLNALIQSMDSGRATAREAIAAAAVENELLSHAEILIDRNNQVRERLASKLTGYTALPRYTEPVDHGPLVADDEFDREVQVMERQAEKALAQRFSPGIHRQAPPEMRQRPPFQPAHPGPGPASEEKPSPFPASAFYRDLRRVS